MNGPVVSPTIDRGRVFILVLTLINTIFAAVLSGLQVDANSRADKANRDSQYYALLATNEVIRFGHQSAYDLKLLATTVNQSQQSLVMQLTALELEEAGEKESAAALVSQSEIAQARADKGYTLSLLYSDPRYAPKEQGGFPDQDAYLADLSKAANEFVKRQNTASDEYHKWDSKADSYIGILSILALAFFLLGLAQSAVRMRFFFALSALAIMVLAAVWTGFIMIA